MALHPANVQDACRKPTWPQSRVGGRRSHQVCIDVLLIRSSTSLAPVFPRLCRVPRRRSPSFQLSEGWNPPRCDTRGLSKSNASPRGSLCLLCILVLHPSTPRPSTKGQDRELHLRYTLTRALFVHTCMCTRTCDAYANGCGRIISTIDGIMVPATLSMSRSHPSCKCATHSRLVPTLSERFRIPIGVPRRRRTNKGHTA